MSRTTTSTPIWRTASAFRRGSLKRGRTGRAAPLPRPPLHRRVDVAAAERVQAERRAGDIEVEGEVLAHRDDIAQVALQRIAYVEALCAVAGPQGLDRLARLVDGERRVGAEAQLGREVGHLAARCVILQCDRGLPQQIAR